MGYLLILVRCSTGHRTGTCPLYLYIYYRYSIYIPVSTLLGKMVKVSLLSQYKVAGRGRVYRVRYSPVQAGVTIV